MRSGRNYEELTDSPAYALTVAEEIYNNLKRDNPRATPNVALGIANAINVASEGTQEEKERAETLAHWLFGEKGWQRGKSVSSKSVGRKLVKQVDNIVGILGANEAIVLRSRKDPAANGAKSGFVYWVERIKDPDPVEPQPSPPDQSNGHDPDPTPSPQSGIIQIVVGNISFAVGDLVNVRDSAGLIYPRPVPLIRLERYEDGLLYAVVDTEEMPRYHNIETL